MFPPEHAAASSVTGKGETPSSVTAVTAVTASLGAGAAKMGGLVKDAVGVKLWVRLAQAPSQQMSALAAR